MDGKDPVNPSKSDRIVELCIKPASSCAVEGQKVRVERTVVLSECS